MQNRFQFSRLRLANFLSIPVVLISLWLLRSHPFRFTAWFEDRQALTDTIHRLGVWGPVVLFVLLVLQVIVAVIPTHALILFGGYFYGFAFSLAITLTSTILGSQIAFLIARRFGRRLINRLTSPQEFEHWNRLAASQGGVFYFFAFILPIFPSDLMNYIAGLGTISARRFFLANVLGRLVCATFITLVGSYGLQLPLFFWVVVILAMIILYISWRLYSRRSRIILSGSLLVPEEIKDEKY